MLRLSLALFIGFSTAALAETQVKQDAETCQSCNARHNALKKLQEARVPPPANPTPAATPAEPKDD